MTEHTHYPLVVRGPDNVIEIPEKFRILPSVVDLVNKTRGRVSSQNYTIEEVCSLLEIGRPLEISHTHIHHLPETVQGGYTTLIQLIDSKRWKILCLLDLISNGWSSLEKTPDGQDHIFHTGSRISMGNIPAQYVIQDAVGINIGALLDKQKQQPDIIAWRNKTF